MTDVLLALAGAVPEGLRMNADAFRQEVQWRLPPEVESPASNFWDTAPTLTLTLSNDSAGAAEFIRTFGAGIYGQATLRAMNQDRLTSVRESLTVWAGVDETYDEDTEVKAGGRLACMHIARTGQVRLSVLPTVRNQGLGGALVEGLVYASMGRVFINVPPMQVETQRWLLKRDWAPASFTQNGLVRYLPRGRNYGEEDA